MAKPGIDAGNQQSGEYQPIERFGKTCTGEMAGHAPPAGFSRPVLVRFGERGLPEMFLESPGWRQ